MASNPVEQKQETIADLVRELPRLRVHDDLLQAFEQNVFYKSIDVEDKNTYLGIEVETENVRVFNQDASPYWRMTEDGSLRNSGREFISIPIRAYRAETALRCLFDDTLNSDIDFSERTSIHIHMNVRTMTLHQLKSFLLVYLLVEDALFSWVGHERNENIFCVPLGTTTFGKRLRSLINDDILQIGWLKYTALNLVPIFEKGTVEFRHLYGTKDVPTILQWINFILCLKKYALKTDPKEVLTEIAHLNTSSQYKMFFDTVFGRHGQLLWTDKTAAQIEKSVSYIKTYCLHNPFADYFARAGIELESKLIKFNPQNSYFNISYSTAEHSEEEIPEIINESMIQESFQPRQEIPLTAAQRAEIMRQVAERAEIAARGWELRVPRATNFIVEPAPLIRPNR